MILRAYIILAVIVGLFIGYTAWHHKVYQEGYDACTADVKAAVKKGDEKYEKDKLEVGRLNDVARRREFCSSVLDADMPTCLKNLPPFRP